MFFFMYAPIDSRLTGRIPKIVLEPDCVGALEETARRVRLENRLRDDEFRAGLGLALQHIEFMDDDSGDWDSRPRPRKSRAAS